MATYVCPVCGSPILQTEVIVTAEQDDTGRWHYVNLDEDELNDAVNNVNNTVRCTYPYCGDPRLPDGRVLQVFDGSDYTVWCKQKGFDPETNIDDLPEEARREYEAWADELVYTPWEGVLGDAQRLD